MTSPGPTLRAQDDEASVGGPEPAPSTSATKRSRLRTALRNGGLALAFSVGGYAMFGSVHRHYPIQTWLVWHYLLVWALAVGFCFCALAGGFALSSRTRLAHLPLRERLVFSFATGVLLFVLGLVVVGFARGLGKVFFFAWPALLAAAGAVPLVRTLRRYRRHVLAWRRRTPTMPRPLGSLSRAYGLAGVVAVALPTLLLANTAYDARWYHLPIAEQYAAVGRIARFDEGFFAAALPHLASWIYTWAFLSPFGDLAHHVRLAAALELFLFFATLASLQVLIERLVPRPRPRGAWAALFLFPGILLYDSNLSAAADHVLAFWAAPFFLALLRALPAFAPRYVILMAALAGAAALTKYQAIALLAFPGAALLVRAFTPWLDRPRLPLATAIKRRARLLVGGATFLLVTAPHWLKNVVYYGNPVYPIARELFGGRPFAPGTTLGINPPGWTPVGTLKERLAETLQATLKFGFEAHDWPSFHGPRPVFGYLFTLSLLALPFLRPFRRVAFVGASALVGVAVWYWTYHQDRYLQALLPAMAAVTAAVLVMSWRSGRWVRVPLVLLVMLQIIDGGDVYFLPTHAMLGDAPIKRFADLMASGHRGDQSIRHHLDTELAEASRLLPADAKPLLHEVHLRLGLGRFSVTDTHGHQGAINYAQLADPAAVLRTLRRLRVTHVVWREHPFGFMRLADDLVFFDFARHHLGDFVMAGGLKIARLPERAERMSNHLVAVFRCRVAVATVQDLGGALSNQDGCGEPVKLGSSEALEAIGRARFVLFDARLAGTPPAPTGGWQRLLFRDGYELWSRPTQD